MGRSWKIGNAFGIGIYVHWSFLLLLGFVLFMVLQHGSGLLVGLFFVALVVMLFGCVVLHELGHALMAKVFGIPTRRITLFPLGGVAFLERMSEKPVEELLIALAGPAVNVVIAALLGVALYVGGVDMSPDRINTLTQADPQLLVYPIVEQFMIPLIGMNIGMVLFNMIPAFPMDGGRVLRAALSALIGHLRATEIAASMGMGVSCLFIIFGILQSAPMLALVGLFVFFIARQELAAVRLRETARSREAERVMIENMSKPAVDVIPPDAFLDRSAIPLEPNFSGFTWDRKAGMWIEWRYGRPVHARSAQSE
jgi:Zn-dependent protease